MIKDTTAYLARDCGSPSVLAGTRLESSFRYWEGNSGTQYLFRIAELDDMMETHNQVVMAVRRYDDGHREMLWVGLGGTLDCFADIRAATAQGANELHIHALAETRSARGRVIDDLRATGMAGLPELDLLTAAA